MIGVTALVEYFDSDSNRLLSIVYSEGLTSEGSKQISVPPADSNFEAKKPISAGELYELMGISETTVSHCPARAVLKLLDLRFADDTSDHWEAKVWLSDPVLDEGPQFFKIPCGQLAFPFSIHISLSVDSAGHVKKLSADQPIDSTSSTCLLTGFQQWLFYPARRSDVPVGSTIDLLFRIQSGSDTGWYYPSRSEVKAPLVIVDVFPEKDVPGKWRVWYGDRPVSKNAVVVTQPTR
jgi:hypothetical protein